MHLCACAITNAYAPPATPGCGVARCLRKPRPLPGRGAFALVVRPQASLGQPLASTSGARRPLDSASVVAAYSLGAPPPLQGGASVAILSRGVFPAIQRQACVALTGASVLRRPLRELAAILLLVGRTWHERHSTSKAGGALARGHASSARWLMRVAEPTQNPPKASTVSLLLSSERQSHFPCAIVNSALVGA
jgi:hypothetical protein